MLIFFISTSSCDLSCAAIRPPSTDTEVPGVMEAPPPAMVYDRRVTDGSLFSRDSPHARGGFPLLCPKPFSFPPTELLLFCLTALASLTCFPAAMTESHVTDGDSSSGGVRVPDAGCSGKLSLVFYCGCKSVNTSVTQCLELLESPPVHTSPF